MKTVPLAEAKNHFSAVLKDVELGNEIAISFGKKKETIAVIISYDQWKKSKKRELGTLKNRAQVSFSKDFTMTTDEFIEA
jgi:prevent-host-death family protein